MKKNQQPFLFLNLNDIVPPVPPDIMDDASTSDVTVNEGDNVTLTCVAKGKTHYNPREENSE